ncbi:hypothetical protein FH972_006010 [Carpinus fangiana]|uniref:Uncharacterized protein n=1 Tax=Carpinus fangiana TaxID=176857 RepID=A0A5N6QU85_9ROSI|nr:hypothetical protein FH972_006010 [Carpinus fangiana]
MTPNIAHLRQLGLPQSTISFLGEESKAGKLVTASKIVAVRAWVVFSNSPPTTSTPPSTMAMPQPKFHGTTSNHRHVILKHRKNRSDAAIPASPA